MADNDGEQAGARGSADLTPGTTLSNTYEIVEYLALGGMAEVYRARNIHTDEPVAIKVVLPEYARDETRLALFRKEATVLSRLHHEAIVHYHMFTVEKETNRPYLVMEFVKGTPLSDRMKDGPLDAQSTKLLIQRVATGLSAAHELGVVHRDLSPDNVVLPDGNVGKAKIIDFGIAKDAAGGTLLGGKFAGKYNFVSPEQLGLYGGDITGQSDIYSLGLIAVAALRGEALDMSGSHAEVIDKRRAVPDLSDIDPAIRPAIEAMLTPDPAQRPKTMQDVVDLLASAPRTAKPMPGAADDPWADTSPAKAAEPVWNKPPPPANATVIAPQAPVRPPRPPARGPATVVTTGPTAATQVGSESPFGAYVPPAGSPPGSPPQFQVPNRPPMPQLAGAQQKPARGGAGGLIALVLAVLVLGGAGGFAYTQNWFGLLGPTVTPASEEEVAARTEESATTPVEPDPGPAPSGDGSSLVPEDAPQQTADQQAGDQPTASQPTTNQPATTQPAGEQPTTTQPEGTVEPPPATTETATVEPQPTITPEPPVQPPVAPPPTETAKVDADEPQGGEVPPLEGVPGMLAWVKAYPLGSCTFAQALAADERSITIEAYGTDVPPFEEMMYAFEAEKGFEPDILLRLAAEPQCPVVDFLRYVKPLAQTGPRLAVDTTEVSRGGSLTGNIQATSGWETDILLVDDAGLVHRIPTTSSATSPTATFSAPIAADARPGSPVMVISISSRSSLNVPQSADSLPASAVFPALLREIQESTSGVAIGVIYAKLSGG